MPIGVVVVVSGSGVVNAKPDDATKMVILTFENIAHLSQVSVKFN